MNALRYAGATIQTTITMTASVAEMEIPALRATTTEELATSATAQQVSRKVPTKEVALTSMGVRPTRARKTVTLGPHVMTLLLRTPVSLVHARADGRVWGTYANPKLATISVWRMDIKERGPIRAPLDSNLMLFTIPHVTLGACRVIRVFPAERRPNSRAEPVGEIRRHLFPATRTPVISIIFPPESPVLPTVAASTESNFPRPSTDRVA